MGRNVRTKSSTRKGISLSFESIPHELKEKDQWVNISADSKLPLSPFDGYPASSTSPCTWGDYQTAVKMVSDGCASNIGFVFNDDYVAVDLDEGVFDEYRLLTPFAIEIINKFSSYTEKSRSGRGIHIIVKGSLPFKGRNNHQGVEIYTSGRYFIMTGNTLLFNKINTNQSAIDWLIEQYFTDISERVGNSSETYLPRIYKPIWQGVEAGGRIKLRPTYPPITSGSRNISMTSLAGSLHTIGYSKENILSELTIANATACTPPLSQSELKIIVNSVSKYRRKN